MNQEDNKIHTTNETVSPANDVAGKAKTGSPASRRRVLLLAFVAAVSFMVFYYPTSRTNDSIEPPVDLAEARQQTISFQRTSDYEGGIALWENFLNQDRTPEEQAEAYQQIASFYLNQQDYQSALDNYRKAEDLNPESKYGLALATAKTALHMNDKATAREYYQKAIEALDQSDPLYDANKASLEQKVQELQ